MTDLDEAILLYVGQASSPYPREDEAPILKRFGAIKGRRIRKSLRLLITELGNIKPSWEGNDLVSVSKFAAEQMASRHPELSVESLAALEWLYSWWWR